MGGLGGERKRHRLTFLLSEFSVFATGASGHARVSRKDGRFRWLLSAWAISVQLPSNSRARLHRVGRGSDTRCGT